MLAVLTMLAACSAPARAQQLAPTMDATLKIMALPVIGGVYEDQLRTAQLWGSDPDRFLLRSTSTLLRFGRSDRPEVLIHPPTITSTFNSAIPYSPNQGDLWGGRGLSVGAIGGASLNYGPLSLTIAPQWSFSQNRDFEIVDNHHPDRSEFSPPWQRDTLSIDLPLRYGEDPLNRVTPGQSSLTIAAGGVAFGGGTEHHWWGPGVRNAIVLSNNGPGFPHLFLRTDRPADLGIGHFEGVWISGLLSESGYFSNWFDPTERSLSAAAVTFSPAFEPGLAVGVARSVYAEAEGFGGAVANSAAVFIDWSGADELTRDERLNPSEQITSLFARWVLPRDRAEVYAEWARYRLPLSVRDFLAQPNHSQGYTVGAQWSAPAWYSTIVRLNGEATYLERSSTFRLRPVGSFYTSMTVPQGYTHRGQVLGAAVGPAGSSQWIAADIQRGTSSAGVFAGRIRWNNDGYYTRPSPTLVGGHDVSILGGIRGRFDVVGVTFSGEYTAAERLNFLYQNWGRTWAEAGNAVDVLNQTLRFTISFAERPIR